MSNLLYVTESILQQVKHHKAYYFWLPIIQNFPIRNIPIEERSFHPRNIEIKNGYIYLTIDMKFVYARDNMFSFLYENQDLSYRFTAYQGILRTLDNKQFSALIGPVARVTASTEVELVDTDKVHHPLFDTGAFVVGGPTTRIDLDVIEPPLKKSASSKQLSKNGDDKPKRRRGRPRKDQTETDLRSENEVTPPRRKRGRPASAELKHKEVTSPQKKRGRPPNISTDLTILKRTTTPPQRKRGRPPKKLNESILKEKAPDNEELVLGLYSKNLCNEIYTLRMKMKKNYDFLNKKFGIDKKVLRKICKSYRNQEKEI